jgi:hypothetical protein
MLQPPQKRTPNYVWGVAFALLSFALIGCIAAFVVFDVSAFKTH